MKIKIISVVMMVIILMGLIPNAASAEGVVCEINDYSNTYVNTGDQIEDLIGVAKTQVGYYRQERTPTKYGVWYGYPNDAWCAMFISWCADQAGIPKDVIKKFCRCSSEADWFKSNSQWEDPEGYVPKAGDIIFFSYSKRIDHVGIVTGADDSYIYCIEGNHANSVNITQHDMTSPIITGYGTPEYDSGKYINVIYRAHVQSYDWLDWTGDGATAGTTGEARRMEAVEIKLEDSLPGCIEYRVHVQSYGWLDWVGDGATAGTTGEARRMEAIEIRLTGEMAEKYDVYYRVHVQSYGWLDWVSNGAVAGTTGEARRVEAVEVKLVEK